MIGLIIFMLLLASIRLLFTALAHVIDFVINLILDIAYPQNKSNKVTPNETQHAKAA